MILFDKFVEELTEENNSVAKKRHRKLHKHKKNFKLKKILTFYSSVHSKYFTQL